MNLTLQFFLLQIFAYLCGSIPFGLIVSKLFKNMDIREYGSHVIGATNAVRTMGKKLGTLVFLLDGLKTVVALILAKYLYDGSYFVMAITACMIVTGHIFPIWIKFKGGRGITCLIFSLLMIDYKLAIVFLLAWGLLFILFRMSSVSSLGGTVIVLIASLFVSKVLFIMMLFLTLIIFYGHIDNIKRIINDEELGFRSKK